MWGGDMGGGRDNAGAALYKRVNGKYVRVGSYKDNEKEANRLISEIINQPINPDSVMTYFDNIHGSNDKDAVIVNERPLMQRAVLQYLRAIDKRDKNAVIGLDKKLKNGDFGTGENQQQLSRIRKTLLEIAKNSPEKVTKIRNASFLKASKMITVNEKLKELQKKFAGKQVKLKNDVKAGWYDTMNPVYYPKGEEGTVLKVNGNVYEIPDLDGNMMKVVSYNFLMQWKDGSTKWISAGDIQP